MKSLKYSIVAGTAGFVAILMAGVTATAMAQAPTPSHDKLPHHQDGKKAMKDMKDMQGMSGMMGGAHHVLAMAYRDNMATFGRALQGQVTRSKTVDIDMARPAVAEMTRSFDQMKQHHNAHMTMMADQAKPATPAKSEMMEKMETHLASLSEHLTALTSEVNTGTPDPRKVSEHTSEILKHSARMSAMPAKAKPH